MPGAECAHCGDDIGIVPHSDPDFCRACAWEFKSWTVRTVETAVARRVDR